ncbi:MAG: GH92 family glycosyl hydrolase, partial [Candidatus Hydrogenedentes bacterium]|nr:GH92 family glycosyl hydrolase [Candidatus Hydrogenedentota bacterium]
MSSQDNKVNSCLSLGLAVALLVAAIGCGPKARAPLDYVDPNIGGIGYLLQPAQPHVQMPHGMARLAPITTPLVKDRYLADRLYGFRAGGSTIMPTTGALEKEPARFASLYDHDLEKVTPYSYEALLESYDIKVEYAPTATGAYYRFTFPKDTDPHVVFSMRRNPEVEVRTPNVVAGGEETPFGGKAYFYAVFSQPFVAHQTWKEESSGVAVDLARRGEPTQVDVKVGFSLIGTEQARGNIEREMPDWNLDAVRARARQAWEREFAKVEVKGGTEEQRTIFYSALYRAMGRPTNLVEGDKYYSGADHQVHASEGHGFYTVNNLWGSYRSLHPLQLLLDPARQLDFVRSYIKVYEQSGWMQGYGRPAMVGHHMTALIADTYFKGYREFDLAKAYEGLRKNRMEATMIPWRRGPATALDRAYYEKGFFPALRPGEKESIAEVDGFERRQSVAVTLEAAYDDWCLAQLAKELGKQSDYEYFTARSRNYRNVFDERIGFMAPKTADGKWIEPFDPTWSGGQGGRDYFTEMNSWIYTWHVQQDVEDLIRLMGGREKFSAKLDQLFREQYKGFQEGAKFVFLRQFPDQTGLIGQYGHGNEPSFHIPYLYNYSGEPWKTQRKVREIMHIWYRAHPLGFSGDEDEGELSSWYVLSAMGFYPVCPGKPVYDIGSPIFEEVKLHLGNGKTFRMLARNVSAVNKYIQSAEMNGKPLH